MTALPETTETVLDALERQVQRGEELAASCDERERVPKSERGRLPWITLVECPTLAALCVLARAAIASIEDLSPEEAAAVEVLERES